MKKFGIVLGIALALIYSVCSFIEAENDVKEQACETVMMNVNSIAEGFKKSMVDTIDLDPYMDEYRDENGAIVTVNHKTGTTYEAYVSTGTYMDIE